MSKYQHDLTPQKLYFSLAQEVTAADTGALDYTSAATATTGSGLKKKMKRLIFLGKGGNDDVVKTKQKRRSRVTNN